MVLSDDDLLDFVAWPNPATLTGKRVREIIKSVRRFIDFDQTISDDNGWTGRDLLCGKLLHEFLAEEPFIIQTWNPAGARDFFFEKGRFASLPRPRLILDPPNKVIETFTVVVNGEDEERFKFAKDFEALGITGVQIIDDMPHLVHAPGCVIVLP